ncbi:MAG: SDR family NAD(P)-dependent oxidoreductase [Syntrophobacteraceae bacterium]|nr:SDR family NAD(P)-dependent oxidoreductase [Syntrophobacteraceae bacterium]
MENIFNLQGKTALVTGASSGLGRGFAKTLAEAGADVIITGRNLEGLNETEESLKQYGGKILSVIGDMSIPVDVAGLMDEIASAFGRLDIAVNNAGITHKPNRFHEIPIEDWNRLISINLTGVFMCMQHELRMMVRQQAGAIINITSILGIVGLRPELNPRASYIAAKHALIGLTKQAALEYAGDGIKVNAIAPGWFEGTNIARERLSIQDEEVARKRSEQIINSTPLKRNGKVEDLDALLLYLSSEASSFMTGQTLVVDGGWTAC